MKNLFCLLAAVVAFNASAAFACEDSAETFSAETTERTETTEVVVAETADESAEAAAE